MRSIVRRLLLGLGMMLLVAGVGIFLIGHELLRMVISFGVEDEAARENVFKAFGGGVVLCALGAGVLAAALPAVRAREPSGGRGA